MIRSLRPVLIAGVLGVAAAGAAETVDAQEAPDRAAALDSAEVLEERGMQAYQAGTAEDLEAAILFFLEAAPLYARAWSSREARRDACQRRGPAQHARSA